MFSHVGWWEMDKGRSVHWTQSVHREVLLSSVHTVSHGHVRPPLLYPLILQHRAGRMEALCVFSRKLTSLCFLLHTPSLYRKQCSYQGWVVAQCMLVKLRGCERRSPL